ncbi:spore coat protein CotJB [Paenibacillus psychroresistens]|nr:spore coat protein CotJB [Paenibacillus psychroresistens]
MTKLSEVKSVKLLEMLQAIDYALVELNLYLDVIPGDSNALQQFNTLNEQREEIRSQLHAQLGAISSYNILSDPDNRKWSLAP